MQQGSSILWNFTRKCVESHIGGLSFTQFATLCRRGGPAVQQKQKQKQKTLVLIKVGIYFGACEGDVVRKWMTVHANGVVP